MIRNYPGFPDGVSGDELTRRLSNQAASFNARFIRDRAVGLTARASGVLLRLADGGEMTSRLVVVATGAAIRRIGIQNVDRLAGKGVAYGSTVAQPDAMTGEDVVVVGADASTGPAAVALARYAQNVTIVLRGAVDVSLSPDLVKQIERTKNIRVRVNSQVIDAYGESRLEGVIVRHRVSGTTEAVGAHGLFVLMGAEPGSAWLKGTAERDQDGYLLTGPDLESHQARAQAWPLDRAPLCSRPAFRASLRPAMCATVRRARFPWRCTRAPSRSCWRIGTCANRRRSGSAPRVKSIAPPAQPARRIVGQRWPTRPFTSSTAPRNLANL